ncbi:hypothetical protein RS9916_28114 [Synechococcus sp. RS9916]|nr:hypothetical protein RS9916_28114 [Synechococcus sp. RS9916]
MPSKTLMKTLASSLLLSSLLSISSAASASAQPLDMEKLLENVPEYQDLSDMEKGFMKMGVGIASLPLAGGLAYFCYLHETSTLEKSVLQRSWKSYVDTFIKGMKDQSRSETKSGKASEKILEILFNKIAAFPPSTCKEIDAFANEPPPNPMGLQGRDSTPNSRSGL